MALTGRDKMDALEEILGMMDDCASILRRIDDERINVYVLAEFEGKASGWLGTFARDHIEEALEALRKGHDED